MHFSNTFKLAKTKFRIRRIRLTIGIIILVLLFSASLTALITIHNARQSLNQYASSGLNGRYLVNAQNVKPQVSFDEQELIDLAIKKYNEATAKEKAAHEKLGLEYTENRSLYPLPETGDGHQEFTMASPYSQAAYIEYMTRFHEYTKDDLIRITARYNLKNIFTSSGYTAKDEGSVYSLISGKENLDVVASKTDPELLDYIFRGFPTVEDNLVENFYIDDFKLEKDEIPIIVSYEVAEQLLGLNEMKNPSDEEKYQRHIDIRNSVNTKSFQFCYRNQSSIDNITTALAANADSYAQTTYNIPSAPCSPATIKTDNRSEAEITAEYQQTLLKKELGTYSSPHQQIIKFRIIGVMPNPDYRYATAQSIESNALDLLKRLVSSGLSTDLIAPKQLLEQNSDTSLLNDAYAQSTNTSSYIAALVGNSESYIAEFNTPEDAQSFITKYNCEKDLCDPDKPFKLTLFGNNSVLIDQFFNNIVNILIGIILIVFIVAFIVLFNIINRILTDSQKETAVFRAIGYRKSDITKIYLTYIAIYSTIVYALTIILTTISPWIINALFSEKLGLYFTTFFDATELTPFNFASFEPLTLLTIIPIFLIGILSAIIPLAINSRRNIIKNLRQE